MFNALLLHANNLIANPTFDAGGWKKFGNGLNTFFRNGLGGDGAKGIGIGILVVGIIAAIFSFAMHKFNPQSRLPSWIMCLFVAVGGAVLVGGLATPIKIITAFKDWFLSLLS